MIVKHNFDLVLKSKLRKYRDSVKTMTHEEIYDKLLALHKKYSGMRKTNMQSQMCMLWSVHNPPDILEGTKPLEELEDFLEFGFEEEEAVTFYDMNILEATGYIWDLINSH